MAVKHKIALLLLVALSEQILTGAAATSCIDDDGKEVDWFIAYKIPKLNTQPEPFDTGYAYAYITSDNVKEADPISKYEIKKDADLDSVVFLNKFKNLLLKYLGLSNFINSKPKSHTKKPAKNGNNLYWTISEKIMTDPDSMIMRTLSIAYDKKKGRTLNSLFYNDQPAVSEGEEESMNSGSRAHAKGVVLIEDDTNQGLWLTHSVPQFPPKRDSKLEFFGNTVRFGQTFMCISFDVARSGPQIVEHLINMYPTVYDSQISQKLLKEIPNLSSLALEGERKKKKGVEKLAQVITTRAGQPLHLFSKSNKFNEDLYTGWIDKEFKSALYVETWRRGSGNPLQSSCPKDDFHVNNVQDLKVVENGDKVLWSYLQDHSKWAISDSIDPGVVCIADINRMESQFKRGGGAVCITCPTCWSVFSQTINDLEPCSKSAKRNKIKGDEVSSVTVESSEDLIKKLGQLALD